MKTSCPKITCEDIGKAKKPNYYNGLQGTYIYSWTIDPIGSINGIKKSRIGMEGSEMIEMIEDLPEKVVAVNVSGVVKDEDYDKVLIPAIEDKMQKYGKIRMLYRLDPAFEKFTHQALLKDAKVGTRHFTSFEKIAVVSDVDWMNSAVEIFKYVIPGPVKTYRNEELSEARAWISE
jgi:hypothetical protein